MLLPLAQLVGMGTAKGQAGVLLLPLLMNLNMLGQQSATSAGVGRRGRAYVDLRGRFLPVADQREAERLLKQLHQAETLEKQQRKKLKIALRRVEVSVPENRASRERQVQQAEARLDATLERIDQYQAILEGFLAEADDEEEALSLLL